MHIIEARELKAENNDGSSDPVVYVECFGQKMHTQTIRGQLNCVWDEVLIFNLKDLAKESFEDGVIRIAVRGSYFFLFPFLFFFSFFSFVFLFFLSFSC